MSLKSADQMNHYIYKSYFLISLILIITISANAQQSRFIYIQTENSQPFYVKMDNRLLSSSSNGHIIIPKLKDSIYNISIGFPKKEWSEQLFKYTLIGKDVGFLLKNLGEKGWGLLHLQTMQLLISEQMGKVEKIESSDAFTTILSNVVNDPSIRQKLIEKSDTAVIVKTFTIPVIEEKLVDVIVKKSITPIPDQIVVDSLKSVISKIESENSAEGFKLTYIDNNNFGKDTIGVLIPVEKKKKGIANPIIVEEKIVLPVKKEETVTKETRFIDMELQNPNLKSDSGFNSINEGIIAELKTEIVAPAKSSIIIENKQIVEKVTMINSDCKKMATDEDFLKLRKLMAAVTSDDEMITAARKKFKSSCYSTDYIKNLGALFLSDEGKYKFYDAAYPFVSDSHNFETLESQLTDTYFITRFKAMLRH